MINAVYHVVIRWSPFPLEVDLRDDPSMIEKLAKNKQKPISSDVGEKLAKELKAVKYVECSALTQVCRFFILIVVYTLK